MNLLLRFHIRNSFTRNSKEFHGIIRGEFRGIKWWKIPQNSTEV
jgi:hypothetical protein